MVADVVTAGSLRNVTRWSTHIRRAVIVVWATSAVASCGTTRHVGEEPAAASAIAGPVTAQDAPREGTTADGPATAPTTALPPPTAPTTASLPPTGATVATDPVGRESTDPTMAVGPAATLPTDRPVRVLVVGDSVAASLSDGPGPERSELADGSEVEVRNVASVACPVILDGGWWFTDGSTLPRNPVCDRPDRYDRELATFAPDVVFALFGWPGAGGGQRFPDGTVSQPCDERFDAAWDAGYRDLIDGVAPHAVVVVSTVAPIAMDARRDETRCLNEIVRRLPATVFDLQDWLCPGLDCSLRAELRTDGVHFADEPGLRRAAASGILEEVVRLAAG